VLRCRRDGLFKAGPRCLYPTRSEQAFPESYIVQKHTEMHSLRDWDRSLASITNTENSAFTAETIPITIFYP
jgi:hypothetical protein